jgi:mono/diheme cytochrome c family protein
MNLHLLTKPSVILLFIILLLASLTLLLVDAERAESDSKGDPVNGKYIFSLSASCACHGDNLAGYKTGTSPLLKEAAPFGERFDGPFGSVPTSNITPDVETGIGGWSDEQIINAIRMGVRPDGSHLFPIMPYPDHSGMSDTDVWDLVAYLRTVPAVKNKVPAKKLNPPPPGMQPPPPLPLQKPPATSPKSSLKSRGEYLVKSIVICGVCHTTTTNEGMPVPNHYMAGNVMMLGGELTAVPNITPDKETGIGSWSAIDIGKFLKTGKKPDGTETFGLMMELVQKYGYKYLTDGDARAIGAYLKTIPAVKNSPQLPPQPQQK